MDTLENHAKILSATIYMFFLLIETLFPRNMFSKKKTSNIPNTLIKQYWMEK